MLTKILNFAAFCGVSLLVAGCSLFQKPLPPYQIIEQTADAHRLAFSQSKPMGCMLVGEKEGRARVGATSGATMELLRESARNDLLNKSAYLVEVGSSKRLVVYQSKEIWMCTSKEVPEIPCANANFKIEDVSSLRVAGEIYECKF